MNKPFVFLRTPNLEEHWPFVPEALIQRLEELGGVEVIDRPADSSPCEETDFSEVLGIVTFGHHIPAPVIEAAPRLRAIGGVFDNAGTGCELDVEQLQSRGITVIDATRGWAQSVAECGLALALCALRSIPQWHKRMAERERLWVYEAQQFCDNSNFVNGTLGDKTVGVMGLGAIGGRVARWCVALGSNVCGFDPYLPQECFDAMNVRKVSLDELVEDAEVVFVAIPPTPSAKGILNRERIGRLSKGSLVTIITRAHSVDMQALRERILADEVFGAFDVYDQEPLPEDDALRGRDNVVHTPHIAGRTRDANLAVANLIAEDFLRIAHGEVPLHPLASRAVQVRNELNPAEA